jgi:hypothetical protein
MKESSSSHPRNEAGAFAQRRRHLQPSPRDSLYSAGRKGMERSAPLIRVPVQRFGLSGANVSPKRRMGWVGRWWTMERKTTREDSKRTGQGGERGRRNGRLDCGLWSVWRFMTVNMYTIDFSFFLLLVALFAFHSYPVYKCPVLQVP